MTSRARALGAAELVLQPDPAAPSELNGPIEEKASAYRAALAYSRTHGWRVFPVANDCRTPLCRHGCHDASADQLAIERLWRSNPVANVALACGPATGVFALDVDVKTVDGLVTLARLEIEHGALPVTWMSRTPSGGRHLFFAYPARKLRNRVGFAPGLDCRAQGGSVALPPSRRADGRYAWGIPPSALPLAGAPDWLLDLIAPPEPPTRARTLVDFRSLDKAARYVAGAVDGERRRLACMGPNSGRNLRLFQAAANLGEFIGAGILPKSVAIEALESAAVDNGLVSEDGWPSVRASIRSGFRKGMMKPREIRA